MRFFSVLFLLFLLLVPAFAADPVNDDTIYDQVRIQIANDREIGGSRIEVKVQSGEVELTGKVRSEKQKMKAGKIARKVKGVKTVVNNITVAPV